MTYKQQKEQIMRKLNRMSKPSSSNNVVVTQYNFQKLVGIVKELTEITFDGPIAREDMDELHDKIMDEMNEDDFNW